MAKILIAEDDLIAQKLIERIVLKMGHQPLICSNGKEAYDELLKNRAVYELLITDVMMPEMDGRELITHIRKNEKINAIPIIIVSAVIGVSDISHLMEQGATYFMAKPINVLDLMEYINRCVD